MQATKQNHFAYNTHLQPIANALRKTMTKAEVCLWKHVLRAGGMKGYTFRRQRPVLNYIADFMCMPLKLIIEVDGNIHHSEDVAANDLKRQNDLEEAGFTLLRFTNVEVLERLSFVRIKIEDWVDAHPA